jgi:hypothetical protein
MLTNIDFRLATGPAKSPVTYRWLFFLYQEAELEGLITYKEF